MQNQLTRSAASVCIVIFILGAALTGCSTNKGGYTNADQVSEKLVGKTVSNLVRILGAPTESIDLGEAGRSITYRAITEGLTGGSCRISLMVQGGVVTSTNVFSSDRSFVSFPMGGCESLIKQLD